MRIEDEMNREKMITFKTTSGEVIQPPPYTPKVGGTKKRAGAAKPNSKIEVVGD